jgi:hypothetical protein
MEATMTSVIHMNQRKHFDDEMYIGRGSPYGNPYKISRGLTRMMVIRLYRENVLPKFNEHQIAVLIGKKLVCYCSPLACHGDMLMEAADELERKYEYEQDCDEMQRQTEEMEGMQ